MSSKPCYQRNLLATENQAFGFRCFLSRLLAIFLITCRSISGFTRLTKNRILCRPQSTPTMTTVGQPVVTYIEPTELVEMIRENQTSAIAISSFIVIDVRDDDYYGGHISGAVNIPSVSWNSDETVEKLVEEYATFGNEKATVIFHCFQSLIRGPSCAQRFANRLSFEKSDHPELKTEVKVLRGGYKMWRNRYGNEADLIEDKVDLVADY